MPKPAREVRLSFRFKDGTTDSLPLDAAMEQMLRQWHALAESADPATRVAARENIRRDTAEQARLIGETIVAGRQRRAAGAAKKPPRRSPLRQSIIQAMRPLRAEGLSLHQALLSLAHSPPGALRVNKEGSRWACRNEDEDWPTELLTRSQLQELFKATGK